MKKIIGIFAAALFLTACGQAPTTTTTQETTTATTVAESTTVTLNITKDGEAIEGSPFTLAFKEGDNLLDVMKVQLKIVEKDGFISSINGVEQVPAENKYWLFDVNGTMSPVGAKEVILKSGDVIDWKLNKLQ
ncbi:MAG: DUF4430 domain-containing protein [Granulicatella adiacens]|nr:DUF4430 domain-containing protein [Granulicatella adiacens]